MNKRGISAIVAVVLIILITVAGVAIIWMGILPIVRDNIEFNELNGRVFVVETGGYTLYDVDRAIVSVQVKREPDEGVMDRVRIGFLIDGNSVSSTVVAPDSGGTKNYFFDFSGYGEPDSVKVSPIFVLPSGKEKEGVVMSRLELDRGEIERVRGYVYGLDRDYFYEVPTSGLVSMWTFSGYADDNWGMGDGTFGGNASVVDGVLSLDGDGDYVNMSIYGLLDNIEGDISISLWVYLNESRIVVLAHKNLHYTLAIWGDGSMSWSDSSLWNYDSFGRYGTVPVGFWEHLVVTKSGSNLTIYQNKNVVVSKDFGGPLAKNNNSVAFVGCYGFGTGSCTDSAYFKGFIDDVMIFNRALSREEVDLIYGVQKKV